MNPTPAPNLTLSSSERDHIKGPSTAPLTLVEYGDYECPYCGQAYYVVKELEQLLGNLMRFVFRNYPLKNLHPNARHVAEAAEAGGAQDKFWEMHDCLFENQEALDDAHLLKYAAKIGLDLPQFRRDMAERRFAARVREDFLIGVRSGAGGAPAFFINGELYEGPYDLDSMLGSIERAVDKRAL
jgi:protein-disulfide isomerase